MLASAETIRVVAEALRKFDVSTLVIDPVMVSTSGSHLLPETAIKDLLALLVPRATLLTPNIPEAKLLLTHAGISTKEPENVEDLIEMARQVQALGPKCVLLKGGHLPLRKDGSVAKSEEEKEKMVDILYGGETVVRIESAYLRSRNTHGTGCSLACGFFMFFFDP